MGFMTIDGQRVEFTNEPNVLTVIRNAEIDIPTLCYHSELSIYGACRLCTVENDRGKTFASCAEPPRDGMVIYTNTPRLMRYRRTILELLLAAHDRDCTTCVKSGECHLLELAHRMGVDRIRFKNREAKYPIDESSPAIVRNPNKCILCGDCVRMCDNVQSVNAIDFAYRGTSTLVTPAFNKTIAQTNCVNCGQCRVVCPTGAISIKTNIDESGTRWRTPTPLWWRRWLRRSVWRWATSSASPRAKTSWASWSMPCTDWASMRSMTLPTARTSP